MSDFKAKMHQIRFRLGLCPRHRWELTALPQTPYLDVGGLLLRGRGREGREGRGGGGKGGRGEEMGGEGRPPRFC